MKKDFTTLIIYCLILVDKITSRMFSPIQQNQYSNYSFFFVSVFIV